MTNRILNLIAAAIMIFFAVPKLTGAAKSKVGFIQFEEVLGINADLFRVFTGVTEIIIAILLIIISFKRLKKLDLLTYLLLSSTMVVALVMEFLVRPTPKLLLVGIAIFLLIISAYRLNQMRSISDK